MISEEFVCNQSATPVPRQAATQHMAVKNHNAPSPLPLQKTSAHATI